MGVYPNPTEGQVNVALSKDFGSEVQLMVRNTNGQVVLTQSYSNSGLLSINLSDMPAGVYYLSVQSESHSASQKVTLVD
jgi:hypothetical protein